MVDEWFVLVVAVQHERGPRNSTIRRQMALYLKEAADYNATMGAFGGAPHPYMNHLPPPPFYSPIHPSLMLCQPRTPHPSPYPVPPSLTSSPLSRSASPPEHARHPKVKSPGSQTSPANTPILHPTPKVKTHSFHSPKSHRHYWLPPFDVLNH